MIGLMPAALALLVELERPVQVAVVGERQGVHALLFGPLDQLGDRAGAVEQAVVAVAMQMNERPSLCHEQRSLLTAST